MRINNNSGILRMYEQAKATGKSENVVASSSTEQNGKTDRVSISRTAAQNATIGRAAQKTAAEIEVQQASPAHIAQITEQVNSGSYYVPTDKLAGAILDTFG